MSRKDKGKAKELESEPEDEEIYEEWSGIGTGGEDVDEASDAEQETLPSFANLEQADMDEEDSDTELEVEKSFNGALETVEWTERKADCPDDLLPEWKGINLHTSLKRALLAMDFIKPTGIQSRAIGPGLAGRDLVGIAETVSLISRSS